MKACMVLLLAAAANAQYLSYGAVPSFYSGLYAGVSPISYYQPSISGHKLGKGVYSNDAVSSFNYAAKGRYMADSVGAKHFAKREAEPFYYSAGLMTPTVYSAGYVASPYVYSKPVYGLQKTFSDDVSKPFNYAAKGMYHADSVGAKHIAKREAEPFYYNSAISPVYTTGLSGYSGVSGISTSAYGYTGLRVNPYIKHSGLYKREAEAEPFYYNSAISPMYTSGVSGLSTSAFGYTGLRVNPYISSSSSLLYKREAEAEPFVYKPYTSAFGYSSFPATTYSTGFSGYNSFPATTYTSGLYY